MTKMKLLSLILFILLLGLTGCNVFKDKADSSKPVEVKTIKVEQVDLPEELELNGIVNPEPNQSTKVAPVLTGLLVWIEPKVGDVVQKNQVVARIQDSVQAAQVQQAEAALNITKATLSNAQKNQNRISELYKEKIAAGKDVDLADSQEQSALAQVEQAQANLNQANANLRFTQILSPIQGIVAERYLNVGDQTSPTAPIFLIVNPKTVIIQANLPAVYHSHIVPGQEVSISPPGESEPLTGKVLNVGIKVDQISNTVPVQITVANTNGILKIGMVVKLKILLSLHKSVLVVPQECLIVSPEDPNKYFVNKVGNGVSSPVLVKIGVISHGKVEILDGLKIGEIIITDAAYELPSGTKVHLNDK